MVPFQLVPVLAFLQQSFFSPSMMLSSSEPSIKPKHYYYCVLSVTHCQQALNTLMPGTLLLLYTSRMAGTWLIPMCMPWFFFHALVSIIYSCLLMITLTLLEPVLHLSYLLIFMYFLIKFFMQVAMDLFVFILQYSASLFGICAFRICHTSLYVPGIPSPSR